jgi:tRNA U38,U39,U40 pseudouridine synthase TruA
MQSTLEASTTPAPAPDKFSGRTDADNRDYVYQLLTGLPAPKAAQS